MRASSFSGLLLAVVAFGQVAHADVTPPDAGQIARAEQLFDQGMVAWKTGDRATATTRFRAAYAIVRTPVTGLPLGKVLRDDNHWIEARAVLTEVGAMPDYANISAQARADREEARTLAATLARETPTLAVRVHGPSDDRAVTVDDKRLSIAEAATPIPIDPGDHVVVVTGPLACPEAKVHAGAGEKKALEWTIDPGQPGEAKSRFASPWPWVGFGVGAAGIAVGSLFGLTVIARKSTFEAACSSDGVCPASYSQKIDRTKLLAGGSLVAFSLAGAGIAFGIGALVFQSPGTRPTGPTCRGPTSDETPKETKVAKPTIRLGPFGLAGTF
jgi:hypothetical protein